MTDSETGDGFDLDLATASLLNDHGDLQLLLKALVRQLSGAFGERLKVERRGGLLRKSDEIRSVEVLMGKEDFRTEVHGGAVVCTVGRASGGIRIRSEEVGMAEWLRRLLASLQVESAHSQSARQALENIVTGGTL